MNEILFLAGFFIATFILGMLLERIRIPWIFSALLIGLVLSVKNPFVEVTSSASFSMLAELGMYFLLFIIGFELETSKIFRSSRFILKTTFFVILAETLLGALFIHYIFSYSWLISFLVASSFATVGEAVLLPILDEFKMVKTKLGQTILSIGVLDDLVEIVTVLVASVLIGRQLGHSHFNIWINLVILCALFGLVFLMVKLKRYFSSFKYKDMPSFFFFLLFFVFLFVGVGKYVESGALGALLAGIALRNIMPEKVLDLVDSEVRVMAYGLFAPIFFLSVGLQADMASVASAPLLIISIFLLIAVAKVFTSFLAGRKELGNRESLVLGTGLCVKLSTSIVILNLLLSKGIIQNDLFSVLVGVTVLFNFVVPLALMPMIVKWKLGKIVKG